MSTVTIVSTMTCLAGFGWIGVGTFPTVGVLAEVMWGIVAVSSFVTVASLEQP